MQMYAVRILAVLLSLGAPALASGNAGDRTMTKVVKMLQEMLANSQADGDKDRTLYATFKCYCDNNKVEKQASIEEYKGEIKILENKIEKISASSGSLSTECAQLKQGIADNEAARSSAKEIREKEAKDFTAEESDMVTGMDAMDQAIETLAAVGADQTAGNAGADHDKFMGKGSLVKLKASVKKALAATAILMSPKQKQVMDSFLQAPFTGTYTSQSGEIVGILKNMRDTFKANLASARAAEKTAQESHKKFMEIKEDEHSTMTASYEDKQSRLGDNDASMADEREKLQEAETSLASDEDFLAKLLKTCADKDEEFTKRNMLRANEEAAISKAVAILNSDAAFQAFGNVKATKAGNTKLLLLDIQHHDQLHQHSSKANVLKFLQGVARAQKSMKIVRIMVLLEGENPFDTVLSEIKKMIAIIAEEQKADEEQKNWCSSERTEYHTNQEKTERSISELQGTIEGLDDDINNVQTGYKVMVKDNEEQLKSNHDNQGEQTIQRQEDNTAYQKNIKHVVAAETLLKKAIEVLKTYYSQFKKEGDFMQKKADPDVPSTWDSEEGGVQTKAGADVISMLTFIAEETKKEETDAHQSEETSQHDFEDAMKTLKEDQATLEETIAGLRLDLAEATKSLGENRIELAKTEKQLKTIKGYLSKIAPGCDYIQEHFDKRTENRASEKTALEKATSMIKETPAFQHAKAAASQEALGDCKQICNDSSRKHAKCEACLAGVSVPGYCAGHAGTDGC